MSIDSDVVRARAALDQAHHDRLSRYQQAALDAQIRQAHVGIVTGADRATGAPLVSVMGTGHVKAQGLTDNFKVGQSVGYFLPRGSAIGSADARPSG